MDRLSAIPRLRQYMACLSTELFSFFKYLTADFAYAVRSEEIRPKAKNSSKGRKEDFHLIQALLAAVCFP